MNYKAILYDVERYGLFSTIRSEVYAFFWQINHILQFLPLLWKDKDYDHSHLLKLIHFKLDLMSKHSAECPMGAKVSPTKRASLRKMRIIMSHIDHFLYVDKYVPYPDFPEREEGDTIPHNRKKDKVYFQCRRISDAENWHWDQIWTKLSRFGRSMWC